MPKQVIIELLKAIKLSVERYSINMNRQVNSGLTSIRGTLKKYCSDSEFPKAL
jgi:hypothetical protein